MDIIENLISLGAKNDMLLVPSDFRLVKYLVS